MKNSKLPKTGTSIFTVMSALANEHGALNLSQGFPDFPVSEKLIERVHHHMKSGRNQYAPMPGTPELRNEISRVVHDTYKRETDPNEEVTIYAGGTEALFATFMALVHEGDEVIVFDPAYDSYDPAIRLAGGKPIHIRLNPPHFEIPWEEVKSKVSKKTAAIVVNSPHNPTGSVIEQSDLQHLSQIAEEYDLMIISDEVYERIIFGGKQHNSVLAESALKDRSIAIFSFGKTFHATGWKIGYSIASPKITAELRKIHQFLTFTVNTPIQLAMAEHLQNPDNYTHLGGFFEKKKDLFASGIKDSIFEPLQCYGTYFQMVRIRDTKGMSDMEFAHKLTKEDKIASIPVSAFYKDGYDPGLLRFCFAKSDDTLEEAIEKINAIRE